MEDKLKVKSIECESITVKHPDSKSKATILSNSLCTGVWINHDNGSCVGLVCDSFGTSYFVGWHDQSKSMPNIAIVPEEGGDVVFQIQGKCQHEVSRVKFSDLAKLVDSGKE